jgi:pimeloyl-ACP methyl ester carboxylesterase
MKRVAISLGLALFLLPGPLAQQAVGQTREEQAGLGPASGSATLVIVHGAWGGGWAWREVEGLLRESGRNVYRPTLTGLGERYHLSSPDIGLDTHITDIVNVLEFEQLEGIVLVGNSYGGMVITGVAERVPERIAHLVYLDAFVPFDGECLRSVPDRPSERCEMGDVSDFPGEITEEGLSVPVWAPADAPFPKDVPQSFKTFLDRVELEGEPGGGLPVTYIITREAPGEADSFDAMVDRARNLGWPVLELIADHNPQWSKPREVTELLLSIR